MKSLKLIISSLLLIIWFAATIILAIISVVTFFPMMLIFVFPEIALLWFGLALGIAAMGGWIDDLTMDEEFLDALDNPEDYH
jgi:hypothetical protein